MNDNIIKCKNTFLMLIKMEKQLMSQWLLMSTIQQPNMCKTKRTVATCQDSPLVCEYSGGGRWPATLVWASPLNNSAAADRGCPTCHHSSLSLQASPVIWILASSLERVLGLTANNAATWFCRSPAWSCPVRHLLGSTWACQQLKTSVNSNRTITCLAMAEKILHIFHGRNPHTERCCSYSKCLSLTMGRHLKGS